LEAEGLLNTRVVFDGDVVEIFQAGRSLVRVSLVDIRDVRLEEGKKRAEMEIETTSGPVLTPGRRPLPLAFNATQLPAAQQLADSLRSAIQERR
jgi:hypothetical protein